MHNAAIAGEQEEEKRVVIASTHTLFFSLRSLSIAAMKESE